MGEETVSISQKEYDELLRTQLFLDCLEACGVDNWAGYEDAQDMMEDESDGF